MKKNNLWKKVLTAMLAVSVAGVPALACVVSVASGEASVVANAADNDDLDFNEQLGDLEESPYLEWLQAKCTFTKDQISVSANSLPVISNALKTYSVSETLKGFKEDGSTDPTLILEAGEYNQITYAQAFASLTQAGVAYITTQAEFEDDWYLTVSFASVDNYTFPDQKVEIGSLIQKPEAPEIDGCVLIGWYTEDEREWDFENDPVVENMTLYSMWDEVSPVKTWLDEVCVTESNNFLLTEDAMAIAYSASITYNVQFSLRGFKEDGSTSDDLVLNAGQYDQMTYAQANAALLQAGVKYITTEEAYQSSWGEVEPIENTSVVEEEAVQLGNYIHIGASAEGGSGEYTYAVYFRKANSQTWTKKQDFSDNNEIKIKPSKAVPYEIRVTARDTYGDEADLFFIVNVYDKLTNTSSLASETVSAGSKVIVNASATGGLGEKAYEVLFRKSGSKKWTLLQEFDTNSTVSFKPKTATTYEICVKAMDEYDNISKKYLTVNVLEPLNNTSSVSSESITLGEKLKINCSATGGAGNYQYKVMYRKATTNKWTTKQDYSDNTTLSIKPSATVDYVIYIKAKDSLGKISSKTFDVRVSAGVTAAE